MATERKRSKGRFLYLFDWNAKSRKKLFSNKTETYEGSIQERASADDFEIPHYLLELNENKDHYSFRGSGNYSCASSVNGDDGHGARAPGVVARLMGLDSMPTMPSCEASSLSSYDSRAVNNSYCPRGPAPFPLEHHILEYSYTPDKLGSLPWSSMDPRRSKVNGRWPIERFQEALPPKSAKPISITHHKLLSPIKSPGFIPTKDAAYIMEAAARILDSSPQPTSRAKVPTLGSPSSSFKLQDLKDKIDAAQRSSRLPESSTTRKHSTPVKHSITNFSGKSSHRSLFKNILGPETSISQKVKNRGKSVPVPVPDKANMQKKEGSVYTEDRSQLQKEHKQVKSKQKQSNIQKAEKTRTSGSKSSGALKQNNDKQNSVNHKEKSNYQTPILDRQPRKVALGNNSAHPSKIVHKVYVNSENRPKKVVTATSVDDQRTPLNGVIERKPSLNRMKNITRDKQIPVSDSQLSEIVRDRGDRRAVQSDLSLQGDSRKDMDVISFTFTSPIKKSSSQSMSSIEDIGSNCHHVGGSPDLNSQSESHTRSSSSPHLGLSLIDSGSLSLLLEKKLKELTDKIVSTKSASGNEGHDTDSASCLSESISLHDVAGSTWVSYDGTSDKDEKSFACGGDCSTALATKSRPKLEVVEGVVGHGTSNSDKCEARASDLAHLNIFVQECFVSGSCLSSSTTSDFTYGYDQPSSPQSQEVTSSISTESIHPREDEADYNDAASYWELDYIRHMLDYAGLKRFELPKDYNVVDPSVFDLLENLINNSGRNVELCSKLDRRILFDCMTDIVSSRYDRVFVGSHKAWAKWGMLIQNEWLTEEVYKEIMFLQSMGNFMVDELIDRDMSTQCGEWLDFEIESLEEGMEIEEDIISSLVDELIDDLCIL